ncbi:MAG: hypothetical protein NVV74_02200 [Magnetospirillum sp.]|nr:hypothetical protein [Magnetospirillum sp.]
MGRQTGLDVLDNRNHGGDGDVIAFEAGVAADQLWFQRVGDDLKVSIIGEAAGVSVLGWYQGAANQVEGFRLADGSQLLAGQVGNLVSAMAAMTPCAPGQLLLSDQQHQQLDPVIAANWQH